MGAAHYLAGMVCFERLSGRVIARLILVPTAYAATGLRVVYLVPVGAVRQHMLVER